MIDPRRNPFFAHSQAAFFLVMGKSQKPIGRLAVLENRNYNQFNQTRTAFFYLFECQEEPEAARVLFEAGCEWAASQGLDSLLGPKGFTALDGIGMLVRGFEHRPAFGLPYNPPYYPAYVEAAGFMPTGEMLSGYLSPTIHFPEKIHEIAELVRQRRGFSVARFKTRKELRAFVPHLKELYNSSLGGTSGNVPLTDEEVNSLANQLLWFADPHLIKIIYKGSEPVGFLFAYPDISAALQRNHGRLFPFGWLDLLVELRRTRWININGAGINEKQRGLGGTALLFSEMYRSVVEGNFLHADVVQIGVENDRMLRELRELGIDFYKMHRLYQKALRKA